MTNEFEDYEAENWSILAEDPKILGVNGVVLIPILLTVFSLAFGDLFIYVGGLSFFMISLMAYVQVRKKTTFPGFTRFLRQKISGKFKPTITPFEKSIRENN